MILREYEIDLYWIYINFQNMFANFGIYQRLQIVK